MLIIVGIHDYHMKGKEKTMYESEFCLNNATLLDAISNSQLTPRDANAVNKSNLMMEALCSDPAYEAEQAVKFDKAENWLISLGIKTRTEYGNLLPTYNLFLEIGEYLQKRLEEKNDE